MRPRQLLVRCYAEKKSAYWVAICLDFTLAAQGDTFEQARALLDMQIREYIFDMMAGEDRPHAQYLLTRSAPARYWAKYYLARLIGWLFRRGDKPRSHKPFEEVMPMVPALC